MFKVLRFFHKAHGHCDVPPNTRRDSLAFWLAKQRTDAQAKRLSPNRLKQLESLGIDFSKPVARKNEAELERRWEEWFSELADFKRRHGHCEVVRRSKEFHDLANWLSNQRQLANAGRLRADRLRRLKELGMQSGRTDRRWNEQFDQVVAYKKQFGHCDVPCHSHEYSKLGGWVSNQRSFRNKGALSQERIARLDKIGFRWMARYRRDDAPKSFRKKILSDEALWDSMFAGLLKHKKRHGHCNVQPGDYADGRLHNWVRSRRAEGKRGQLREDRRRRLDKLGFLWKGHNPAWDKKFAELLAYKKRFGHCDVPARWSENKSLAHWVDNQRCWRRKGILKEDRMKRLDEIGFSWMTLYNRDRPPRSFDKWVSANDELWDYMFAALLDYKKKHGHCIVKPNDGMDGRLHKWVQKHRIADRKNSLRKDRRQRLDEIGFVWDSKEIFDAIWNKHFAKLVAYKKRFGHCDVPARWPGDKLFAHWAHNQRGFKNHGTLSRERIARLNSIGFEWGKGRWPKDASMRQG